MSSYSLCRFSAQSTDLIHRVCELFLCLTELPPVSALEAEDERGHGLVRGARLQLRVCAVLLAALAAFEHFRWSACLIKILILGNFSIVRTIFC